MSDNLSGNTSDREKRKKEKEREREKKSVGIELSACKMGVNRMNVTSVMQSLSLQCQLLLHSKTSSLFSKCLYSLVVPPYAKICGERICIFRRKENVA